MKQPAFRLHLPEKRGAGIGGQDMKRGALEPILLDPFSSAAEHIGAIMVEAQDKAAVDLDAVLVKYFHAARVLIGAWTFFLCRHDVLVLQRFESDENAGAPRERHLANQAG